jgi:hypothetical protein
MSEYINIISQEAITEPVQWPAVVVGSLTIVALLSVIFIAKGSFKATAHLIDIVGASGVSLLILTSIICCIFFKVPTGQYKYEATINKDKITLSQYEEFIEKYNPTVKDGIYYFEGGSLDE